jgi:hypothetical protein
MTCEDFQLRLTAFSLGELEQGEVSDARDHVATCDDCASRLLLDRQLTALLRASAVPAPQETVTAVLATVRAEAGAGRLAPSPRQPARRRHWLPWPRPCWPPPPCSPSPCWCRRPPTRAARCPRPGAPITPGARTASAPRPRPRPTGCSPSGAGLAHPRPGRLRPPQGRLGGPRPGRAPGRGGRVPRPRRRAGHPDALAGRPAPVAKGSDGGELAAYTWGRHTSYWWRGRRPRLVPGRHHRPGSAVRHRRAPGRGIVARPGGLGC